MGMDLIRFKFISGGIEGGSCELAELTWNTTFFYLLKLAYQNLKSGLAKSWKIRPDWKYIDFILREDVTFQARYTGPFAKKAGVNPGKPCVRPLSI
jgi:hypothetical protein